MINTESIALESVHAKMEQRAIEQQVIVIVQQAGKALNVRKEYALMIDMATVVKINANV